MRWGNITGGNRDQLRQILPQILSLDEYWNRNWFLGGYDGSLTLLSMNATKSKHIIRSLCLLNILDFAKKKISTHSPAPFQNDLCNITYSVMGTVLIQFRDYVLRSLLKCPRFVLLCLANVACLIFMSRRKLLTLGLNFGGVVGAWLAGKYLSTSRPTDPFTARAFALRENGLSSSSWTR